MNNQIEIQQLFEKIKSLSKIGKHVEAKEIIDQVIEKYPQSAAEAYYICASNFHMLWSSDPYQYKEHFLMEAIKIEPSHIKSRMALAQLYFPTPVPVITIYRGRGQIALEGKSEKAVREYRRVIEIDPDYSEAYERRAYIYEVTGHHKPAIEDFSHAVKLSPDSAHLRLARGNLCLKTENYDIVLDDLRKVLSLNPANPDAIKFLEAILHKKNDILGNNDIEKIIKEYEENIDVDNDDQNFTHVILPQLAGIYSIFGQILAQNGDHKQAIIKYKKSIEYQDKTPFQKHNSDTHYFLGNTYSDLGQYKEAIVEYDKAIKKDHNHHRANEGRSNALLKLIEKQESDFQGKIEEFLSGPNSIFGLHDRFLEREKECVTRYNSITKLITISFVITSLTIALGIAALGWWINRSTGFSFIESNAFSFLPYIAVLLLFTAVPVWWTRILLKSRDRWQVLQEDCFRKAAIMQYIQATGSDKEFRNHIILETIKHMANRSGADLLVALHADDPGMLYSATDIMEKIIKKKPSNG